MKLRRAALCIAALACFGTPALAQLRLEVALPDRVSWNDRAFGQLEQVSYLRWGGVHPETRAVGADRSAVFAKGLRLQVGLPPGRYAVALTLPPLRTAAAVEVQLDGRTVARVDSSPVRPIVATVELDQPPLEIFLKPSPDGEAALMEVEIQRADGESLAAPLTLPPRDRATLDRAISAIGNSPEERLAAIPRYLERYQLPNGLFDLESSAWWEAGLALRALLLARELRADSTALELARPALELLTTVQGEDGGFCAYAPQSLVPAKRAPCKTRNVADLGVATTCLSLAAPYLSGELGQLAVNVHRDYIDRFVSRYRLPNGAFANGLFDGTEDSTAYSVATATTAMSLCALYARTHEPRYLAWAEEAARFLARSFAEDGRPLFYPHRPIAPRPLEIEEWNDLYYLLEGLLWVREATEDRDLREEIDRALRRFVTGEHGLLATCSTLELPVYRRDHRAQAKLNGMVAVLLRLRALLDDVPELTELVERSRIALLEPEEALDREVLARPYEKGGAEALVATSFAALAYAEMIKPGSAFRVAR